MTAGFEGAEVDHDRCAGIGMCTQHAPGAFDFDDEGQAFFLPSGEWTESELRKAADACPMEAISLTGDVKDDG
ncbi:ferredoxin [Streptosporangium sp. G11]|uniref:ferredoxin n=1 Tax=Streptosporangium sp. G11 TaxID=3436926 RepID=UPI003EBF0E99